MNYLDTESTEKENEAIKNLKEESKKDSGKVEKKDKEVSIAVNFYRILKLVWVYDKKYLIIEFLLTIVKSILPFVLAWYSALFINKITSGELTTIYDPVLFSIVIIYLTLPFFMGLADVWYSYFFNKFYVFFGQYIHLMFIEKRHSIDIQTYENVDFNNLVVRVNENEEKILWFTDWFFYIFGKVVILSSVALILFSYRWWFLPVLVLSILPDLILQIKFGKIKYSIWDAKSEVKRKFNLLTGYFSDLASLTEIKIFKNKDYFKNSIRQLLSSFNVELNDNENKRTKYKNLTTLVELSVGAFIVFFLMSDVINKNLAVGTFIFLLGRMSDSRDSISELFRGFSILSSDNKFVTDVFKFLDTKNIVKNGVKKIGDKTPEIEFKDVYFSYPGKKKNVLNNLNFKIKSGEKIAIVGVNGAGKTTLTKLIMRFYDVKKGLISVGGENIKDIDFSDYYMRIGFLSQNYAHYKLPVKEVVALGNTNLPLDMERVIESAKKAGAHEFISAWENGYETQLGNEFDNGVEPSVGQWQKLALTRMFYKNPQIWILDEPTASIDSIAEMSIFQELESLPKDKTVILISHRFNTVKNADRIMVIEDGEIKEFDSHYKLMRIKDGRYRKLFELQKKSFETN